VAGVYVKKVIANGKQLELPKLRVELHNGNTP